MWGEPLSFQLRGSLSSEEPWSIYQRKGSKSPIEQEEDGEKEHREGFSLHYGVESVELSLLFKKRSTGPLLNMGDLVWHRSHLTLQRKLLEDSMM